MAAYLTEPARRTPVIGTYDLVVCGGGPGGIAAAVAAARNKAKVLLVEASGCLGGLGTAGLVPGFCPYAWERAPHDRPQILGLGMEVVDRLHAAGGTDMGLWPYIDAEKLKVVYDQMLAEAKVRSLLFTSLVGAVVKGATVRAVLVENKAGRSAIRAAAFVDGTGDGDLAARAGAPCDKGDAAGRLQGASLCFTVAGVDTAAYFKHFAATFGRNAAMNRWLQQAAAEGKLPAVRGTEYRVISHKSLYPGTVAYNFGHVFGVDGTNPDDLTRAMIAGRQLAQHFVAFMRGAFPGMAGAHVVASASLMGIRETRRVRGRYHLTLHDFEASRHFDDDVAVYDYPIDVHPADRSGKETARTERQMETMTQPPGASYGIPWRTLLPERLDNLLVVGRCISADRMVHGSVRVMPACLATGQAAGTAAAMALRQGVPPARVDVAKLRQALRKAGVKLE